MNQPKFPFAFLALCLFFCITQYIAIESLHAQNKTDESNILVNSGIAKYNQSDFNGAVTDFTKAITLDPENTLAFYNRGLCKYHLNDFYGALADCNSAIKLNPKDANAYNIRGLVYTAINNPKEAFSDFEKAIKNAPKSFWGYFNRAMLYEKQNDIKNALKDYNKSIEFNAAHTASYQNRGLVNYQLKLYPEALADLNQAIYMSPPNPSLFLNRGIIKAAMGDQKNAITDFEEVVKLDPKNHFAYYNLGATYSNVNMKEQACWAFEKATQLGNQDARNASLLADCEGKTTMKTTVDVDPSVGLKANVLEKSTQSEEEIRKYLTDNQTKLDPIEGIWSANSSIIKSKTTKLENPNFAKVAIVKDSINNNRDYKMIFIEGKEYFPNTIIAEFSHTSYSMVYIASLYSLDALKDSWNFDIDDVGMLMGEKNYMEAGIQMKKEFYFIKIFPKKMVTVKKEEVTKKTDEKPSTGSGFVISKNGIIATNAHVISGYSNLTADLYTKNGMKTYKLNVLYKDESNDVGILKIDDPSFSPFTSLPFGIEDKQATGEGVFALGYPLADVMGTELKLTNGIISAKTGVKDDIRYMQITVPLQPGNSGGPLFNQSGNIIGIASARLTGETQNVSYALKILYLNNLLSMLDDFPNDYQKNFLKGQSLDKQVDALKYYVCLIKAKN